VQSVLVARKVRARPLAVLGGIWGPEKNQRGMGSQAVATTVAVDFRGTGWTEGQQVEGPAVEHMPNCALRAWRSCQPALRRSRSGHDRVAGHHAQRSPHTRTSCGCSTLQGRQQAVSAGAAIVPRTQLQVIDSARWPMEIASDTTAGGTDQGLSQGTLHLQVGQWLSRIAWRWSGQALLQASAPGIEGPCGHSTGIGQTAW